MIRRRLNADLMQPGSRDVNYDSAVVNNQEAKDIIIELTGAAQQKLIDAIQQINDLEADYQRWENAQN